jgi:uncharacterized coiled-coil protein SlyX
MSKKLIAVAAAAALALTALVAAPVNASAISNVVITSGNATAEVASGALTASHTDSDSAVTANTYSADRNVYFATTGTATRTAVRFEVNTAAAASTINVTSTGGVKISASTTAAGVALKVDGGTQALNGATVAGALKYTFFAWNTSTTAGSVVIDTGASKLTYFVKGLPGQAYNIVNPVFPSSLFIGQTDAKVTFQVTDEYNNVLANQTVLPTGFGATFETASYSATTKLHTAKVLTVTGDNVAINLALTPNDLSANGFAKPVKSAFKLISAGDLSAQVTALTKQVTDLQAQITALTNQLAASRPIATSVTKKKYNTLARKWNAANPGAKVALKK